ncbi:MAG: alpha/beta fold hydrolase [Actinomycetes bacterium]
MTKTGRTARLCPGRNSFASLRDAFTTYAIDMPGMGWSNIIPGASYTEPALRRALVHFVAMLDLEGLTLAGESMGATIALTASTELTDRVRSVVAVNLGLLHDANPISLPDTGHFAALEQPARVAEILQDTSRS